MQVKHYAESNVTALFADDINSARAFLLGAGLTLTDRGWYSADMKLIGCVYHSAAQNQWVGSYNPRGE